MPNYTEDDLHPRWAEQPCHRRRMVPPRRTARGPTAPLLGTVLSLAPFALLGLQRTLRTSAVGRVSERDFPCAADAAFRELVERFTRAVFRPGHAVEILCNGEETFPRLWADLEGAERSIEVQIYYAESGRVADRTFAVLQGRARAGVPVRFLYDPVGCRGLDGSYLEALRESGVQVHALRPIGWGDLDRINHRVHSRIVLIDGGIGYTGDFGISDRWLGDGRTGGSWRSTNARFRGPALREHSAAFATLWSEATGELLSGPAIATDPVSGGSQHAALLHTSPAVGSPPAERIWALTLDAARESCFIASGYFAPTAMQTRLLCETARRGVDVRVLTASAPHTDVPPAYWAGRARYPELLGAGVKVYEYQPSMMHAKSWVVDGIWCSIGALNLDNRSVALNEEVALMIHDRELGARLEEIFRDDLAHARRVASGALGRAPWTDRAKAWGARMLTPLL